MLIYWIQPKIMPDSLTLRDYTGWDRQPTRGGPHLSHHSPCSYERALPVHFVVVQLLSHVWLFATLWTAARQASLSFAIFWRLFKLMSIESVMPSNCLIPCHPLLLPSNFSSIRVFSNEPALYNRWPKYWSLSLSFSISPSIEYSGSVSFRMGWLDLLALQGTLKSLLQHHSSKASILWRSAFFMVQLSHPHMTSGKAIL